MFKSHRTMKLNAPVPAGQKYCAACDTVKPLSDFYAERRGGRDAVQPECKQCRRARAARHRVGRRKENAAYARAYRAARPGLWRERRAKNPRKWLDEAIAGNQRRKAREKNAPGEGITRKQWEDRKAEYGGRCAYCAKVAKLTMDHMDPLSKGGSHDLANVVPACRECNSGKCDRTILMWLAVRAAA